MSPIAILIVHSSRLYAGGLRTLVSEIFPTARVDLVHTVEAAEQTLSQASFTITFFAEILPLSKWFERFPQFLQSGRCGRPVVLVSRHDVHSLRALRALGPISLVDSMEEDPAGLQIALEMVAAGKRYLSPSLDRVLNTAEPLRPEAVLTSTEERVLTVIGGGSDDGQAASQLGMKSATVMTHRVRIMRKLGLHHRGELFSFALRNGYVIALSDGTLHPGYLSSGRRRSEDGKLPAETAPAVST